MIESRLESPASDPGEVSRGRNAPAPAPAPGRRNADDIRTLRYGFAALQRAAAPAGISSGELARRCAISRAAAYRVLQTLHGQGYLRREGPLKRARYHASARIRSLTAGYGGAVRLLDAAIPLMLAWTEELGWPLALATPAADRAVVRFTTDPVARRALLRYRVGKAPPALTTANTLVCLAHRPAALADESLEGLDGIGGLDGIEGTDTPGTLRLRLARIRDEGFVVCTPRGLREATLAIPLLCEGTLLASLALRYMRIAEGGPEGHARRLATLRALGARLVAAACDHRATGDATGRAAPTAPV